MYLMASKLMHQINGCTNKWQGKQLEEYCRSRDLRWEGDSGMRKSGPDAQVNSTKTEPTELAALSKIVQRSDDV